MVFFAEDVGQGPVTEAMDIAEFAAAVEDFLGPAAGHAEGAGEVA